MRSARAVADDGTWLLVDIKALDTFEQNVAQEPDGVADVRHQRAQSACRPRSASPTAPASARSACRPNKARADGRGGRLHPLPQLDIDHSVNAFYEVRP